VADYGVNIKASVQGQENIKKLAAQIKKITEGLEAADRAFSNYESKLKSFDQRKREKQINEELDRRADIYTSMERMQRQLLANDNSRIKSLRKQADLEEHISRTISAGRMRRESRAALRRQGDPNAHASPIGPQRDLERESRLQLMRQTASQVEAFDAQKKFAVEMGRINERLDRKTHDMKVDMLLQEFKTEEAFQKATFEKMIALSKKELDENAKALGIKTDQEMAAIKKIDKERRRIARESLMLTGQTSPVGGAEGIPGSPAALAAAERSKRLRSAQSSALIGGAFPLLFGQGAGASIGGAAGGFGGGMIGGEFGFGLSLIGTQIGAMVDQLISQSADLGNALQPATANLDAIIAATGTANTEFSTLIGELEEAENSSAALALATSELTRLVGQDGVDALKEFGADVTELSNDFSRAMTIMMAGVAGLINSSNVLKGIIGAVENNVLDAQIRRTILDGGPQAEKLRATFTKRAPTLAEKSAGREPTTKFDRPTEATRNLMRQINEESFKVSMNAGKAALKTKEKLDFHSAESVILRKQLQISEIDGDLTNDKVYKLNREIIFQKARLELEKEGSIELNVQNKRQIELNKLLSKRKALIEKNEKTYKGGGKRSDTEQERIEKRITRLNIESEALRQRVEIEDKITQAKINQDDETVIRLKNEQKILSLTERMKKQLEGAKTEQERIAILQKTSAEIALQTNRSANELKLLEAGRDENYKDLIEQLDHELLLRAATTEEARMQLEIDREIAKIKKDDPDRDTTDIRKKLEVLKSPKRGQELIDEETGRLQDELDLLTDKGFQVVQAAGAIGDAFSESFKGIISGSMTAQEALANLFQRTADHFLDMTAQIIAAAIKMQAIQIITSIIGSAAGGFMSPAASPGGSAGVAGIGGGGMTNPFGNTSSFGAATSLPMAEGGYVNRPTNALIGEGGEPEYVIPESKMRESMSRYSRGSRGNSVIPASGDGGTESGGGGTAVAAPIDVRYTVERINSVDYVTADQFQSGMQSAAAQGAKRGEQNTLKRLQMSGSTRKRLGL